MDELSEMTPAATESTANTIRRPDAPMAVVSQYLRRERLVSGLLVVAVISLCLAVYVATSLLPAVLIGGGVAVALRFPVLRPQGTVRLRTEASPTAVEAAFSGPLPPVLAFQWGVADAVRVENGTATYPTSYLFGLRSVTTAVRAKTETIADDARRVELVVTVAGQPWATYRATIREDGNGTAIIVEYDSDRRFGLRRYPQQLLLRQYHDAALDAQGYSVVERETALR